MPNLYSPSQLDFLRKFAEVSFRPAAPLAIPSAGFFPARFPVLYTQQDVRALADRLLKEAAWVGQGGWLWDTDQGFGQNLTGYGRATARGTKRLVNTAVAPEGWLWNTDQNAAGNLAGYGGLAGSLVGSTVGATAGSVVAPVAGTIGGGVLGGVTGGAAGRGLGYALGSGVDWLMGNKPGENQPGLAGTVFDPMSMAGDSFAGVLPGVGKVVGQGVNTARLMTGFGKGLGQKLALPGGAGFSRSAIKASQRRLLPYREAANLAGARTRQVALQEARDMGLRLRVPGNSSLREMRTFGKNLARPFYTQAGRAAALPSKKMLAQMGAFNLLPYAMEDRPSQGAYNTLYAGAGGAPGAAGTALQDPKERLIAQQAAQQKAKNSLGFTQVVNNASRGFGGVRPMNLSAYTPAG
jgi:hypothetical protein